MTTRPLRGPPFWQLAREAHPAHADAWHAGAYTKRLAGSQGDRDTERGGRREWKRERATRNKGDSAKDNYLYHYLCTIAIIIVMCQ